VIPDEVKNKNIEDVGFNPTIVLYLKENGYKTVRDIIDNQEPIPKKYLTSIKGKLIFGVDI
jgi:hypothetical protein